MTLPRAVCKTWLTIVDTTCHLWTDLVNAPLALALPKSQHLQLKVTEQGAWIQGATVEGWTQRMVALSTAADRIRWLSLSYLQSTTISPLLTPSSHGNTNFPSLQVLKLSKIELTRNQWHSLIQACHNLLHLDLRHLEGDFSGEYQPMEIVPLPTTASLHCTITGRHSLHYGLMFGVKWTKLHRVELDVECEDDEIALARHQDAVHWAQRWQNVIQSKENRLASMTATVRLYAPEAGFTPTGRPNVTSSIGISCAEHKQLRFKLVTWSVSSNGIPPASWHQFPSLVAPITGHTNLVIHPAHQVSMASFNPQAFVQSTRPTNIIIGRATHNLAPAERGNWLQTLWALIWWPHIKGIWTEEGEAGDTSEWVKQQTGMDSVAHEGT